MTAAPVRKSGDREATLEQVLKNLQTGKTAPVYLLFGDETYLVEHARERIVAALLPDGRGSELHQESPTPDLRGQPPKGLRACSMAVPDPHVDAIRVKTRDFR